MWLQESVDWFSVFSCRFVLFVFFVVAFNCKIECVVLFVSFCDDLCRAINFKLWILFEQRFF